MGSKISVLILAVIIGVALAQPAFAGVTVGDNLTLFGDMRYRVEYDTRESKDRTRDRQRLRARFGAKYKVDDNWSMGLRFRTGDPENNGNSPHQTLDGGDPVSAGFDRAYIKYKTGPFSAWAGKNGINYYANDEVVWDADIQPEGIAVILEKLGPVSVNLAHFILKEKGWEDAPNDDKDDTTIDLAQVFGKFGMVKAGVGIINIDDQDPSIFYESDNYITVAAMVKQSNWRVALDVIQGDADDESLTYVGQVRFKIAKRVGLRAYYYSVGAFGAPGDGVFSQDDFPDPGKSGVSNFTGYRAQVDIKLTDKVGVDIRYYSMDVKTKIADFASKYKSGSSLNSTSDAILTDDRTRLQLNLNVKF